MIHVRFGIHYTKPMQSYALRTAGYGELTYLDREAADIAAETLRAALPSWQVQVVEFMADFEVPAEVVPFSWVRLNSPIITGGYRANA